MQVRIEKAATDFTSALDETGPLDVFVHVQEMQAGSARVQSRGTPEEGQDQPAKISALQHYSQRSVYLGPPGVHADMTTVKPASSDLHRPFVFLTFLLLV